MPQRTNSVISLLSTVLSVVWVGHARAELHVRPFTLSHWGGAEFVDIDGNGVADFMLGLGAFGSVEPWTTTFADLDPSSSAYGAVGQTFSVPADPLVTSPEASIYVPGYCGWHDCIPPTLLVPVGTNVYPVAFERDGALHAAWLKIWVGWSKSELVVDYQQIAWEDVPGAPIVLGWVDCDGDSVLDDDEIAADPSLDCNGNHLLDTCERLNDCDSDGIPDVCAILTGAAGDCNMNGLPDSCEIASGAVDDCNADGVPDECQAGAAPMEDGVSLEFEGYWSRASVPHFGLEMPTEEITIEFWQKVEAPAVQTTFRLDWSEDNRCMAHVPWTDGVVYWDFGDWANGGRLQYTPPESIVGTWQHFALQASASGGFMRIYRNGVLEASTSQSDTLTPVDQPLVLGGTFYDAGNGFRGGLDEFRIWNHVRSAEEINANLTTPIDSSTPGLVAYWRINDGPRSVTLDESVANRDADILGLVEWLEPTPLCSPVADLDGDGAVNGADLAILLAAWSPTCRACPQDLDANGAVDAADLAILLGEWS